MENFGESYVDDRIIFFTDNNENPLQNVYRRHQINNNIYYSLY